MSILDSLLNDNSDDKFFKDMTSRPKPPLGKYLQWLIKGERYHESDKGNAGFQLEVVPLNELNNVNSAKDRMGCRHWLGFPRKGDEQAGIKETNGMISWFEVLDATQVAIDVDGSGVAKPIPTRGIWDKGGGKTGKLDGKSATEAEMNQRQAARDNYVRAVQRKILLDAKAGGGTVSNPYFIGQAFFAVAGLDDDGKYVNLISSTGKGSDRKYHPFSPGLPVGVAFTSVVG